MKAHSTVIHSLENWRGYNKLFCGKKIYAGSQYYYSFGTILYLLIYGISFIILVILQQESLAKKIIYLFLYSIYLIIVIFFCLVCAFTDPGVFPINTLSANELKNAKPFEQFQFVRNGYSTIETNFADTYVTSLTFGVLVFMLIFNGFFYIMFVSKKKNGLFYAISAIVYIALIILALLFHGSMSGIKNIDATFANFVRDMANISVLPQYALIISTIVKASGFNIKTLRFEKRAALSVDEDDEEIEIKIGSDKNTTKRNVVHLIRELKYYILENKLVFSILGGAAGIAIIIGLYINFRVNNRVYTFNQEVSSDTFDIALKDSYITDVDYRGNVIAEGKYYLVIKLGLYNKFGDTTIDKSVFRIEFDKTSMFPTYDRSSRFVDIGKPYEGQMVKYQQQDDYVFVYELKPNEVKGTYKLKILNKSTVTNEGLKTSYKVINVKPKNITKEAKDLIQNLLIVDPIKRLGQGPDGSQNIKNHPFFKGVNWNDAWERKIKPPFIPKLKNDIDLKYFDTMFTDEPIDGPKRKNTNRDRDREPSNDYNGFTYVAGSVSNELINLAKNEGEID